MARGVELDLSDISAEDLEGYAKSLCMWLVEHVGPGGYYDPIMASDYRWLLTYHPDSLLVTFKEAKMAVLFKLTWGGR